MSKQFRVIFGVFLVLLSMAELSFAIVKVDPKKVFLIKSKGASYQCFNHKGTPKLVIKQNGKWVLGSDAIKVLQETLGKQRQLNTVGGKKKLKALKDKVATGNVGCKSTTPDGGGGNGGGGSNGGIGSASLKHLDRSLTRADIQYLLNKASLGLSSREESLVQIGLTRGIDDLVNELMTEKPEPAGLLARVENELDGQLDKNTTQTPTGQRMAIYDIWLNTNNPFSEKFALFLLSVWTTAGDVISDETFRSSFWNYYQRLRTFAKSNSAVPDLAVAIARDPLMLIYLNNELNVKGNPNENFARELMELFTLGPTDLDGNANYTETLPNGAGDIATAAKMLTGWKVNLNYQTNQLDPVYLLTRHEKGPHTMFAGKSYAFNGENDEDLVRGIFTYHPGAKLYYAKEILKFYLTPNPSRALVEAFGDVIQSKGFRLQDAMKVLLTSEAFFDSAYKNTVPLNSFEFAAKTARLMELYNAVNPGYADYQMQKMGLMVNQSPSVFWYNSDSWSSPSIVLEKANFVAEILSDATSLNAVGWTPAKILPSGVITNDQLIDSIQNKVGLSLNNNQRQNIISYLSTQLQYNGVYQSFQYNNTNPEHQKTKGLGVFYLLFMTPEFNLL